MARIKVKTDLSRRSFLRRSALLVSSLGLGASVEAGVLDAIVRRANKKFGTALAALPPVDFQIEFAFRLGFQTNALLALPGHARNIGTGPSNRLSAAQGLNYYWSPGMVQSLTNAHGRPVHLTRHDGTGAGLGSNNPLAAWADSIAYSESVADNFDYLHTSNWQTRDPLGRPNNGTGMAPCPTLMHAAQFSDTPIKAVDWRGTGLVTNHAGDLAPSKASLSTVADDAGFVGLFSRLPTPFDLEELKLITGVFDDGGVLNVPGAHHRLDDIWKKTRRMPGIDAAEGTLDQGRMLAGLDLDLSIEGNANPYVPAGIGKSITDLADDFGYNDDDVFDPQGNGGLGGTHLGKTMLHIYRAMALGVLRSVVIDLDSGDWHTDRPATDQEAMNKRQGRWARAMTRALGAFLDYASITPNTFRPGEMMSDSFLISISSEFARTPLNFNNNNNNDGQSQSFTFIGSNVKGGCLGDMDTSDQGTLDPSQGEARIASFNPNSGASLGYGTPRIPAGSVYQTHLALAGIDSSAYAGYGIEGSVIPALLND